MATTTNIRSQLSDFNVLGELGRGSFGVVYKVLRKQDNRVYVMKTINIGVLSRQEQQDSLSEVHILASLNHDHIVRYYDSFMHGTELHIIMEYCTNGDLNQRLRQTHGKYLSEDEIWKYFMQTCLGVQHLHTKKILHRDLKTMNLFLDENDNVKIGDLGVAKVLGSAKFANTIVGTPYYLSPELCEDKPYDAKSDIWALGCVLYELCTLKHPFDARNQGALILKIIQGKYPPLPKCRYSTQLTGILDRCLQKNTRRRPNLSQILAYPSVFTKAKELNLVSMYPPDILKSAQKRAKLSKVRSNCMNGGVSALKHSRSTPDNRIQTKSRPRLPLSSRTPATTTNVQKGKRSGLPPRVKKKKDGGIVVRRSGSRGGGRHHPRVTNAIPRSISQPVNLNNLVATKKRQQQRRKKPSAHGGGGGQVRINKSVGSLDNLPSYNESPSAIRVSQAPPLIITPSASPAAASSYQQPQFSPSVASVMEDEESDYSEDEEDNDDDDDDFGSNTRVGWKVFESNETIHRQQQQVMPLPPSQENTPTASSGDDSNIESIEQQLRFRAERLETSVLETKAQCLQTMSIDDYDRLMYDINNGGEMQKRPEDIDLMGRIYKIVYCQGELIKVRSQLQKLAMHHH